MPVFIDGNFDKGRPAEAVELAILNLTPTDGRCEKRFFDLFESSPAAVCVTPMRADGCPDGGGFERKPFTAVENKIFDGVIVCGEPDCSAFNRYRYWKEFKDILAWTCSNAGASLFTGWSAQAAAYFFYGVKKHNLKERRYGVFQNFRVPAGGAERIMQGVSDEFYLPHDHRSYIKPVDVMRAGELKILAYSRRAGASVIVSADGKRLFVTAHPEYDRYALKDEYEREKERDEGARPPVNYFDPRTAGGVKMNWASASSLLLLNWLSLCADGAALNERRQDA